MAAVDYGALVKSILAANQPQTSTPQPQAPAPQQQAPAPQQPGTGTGTGVGTPSPTPSPVPAATQAAWDNWDPNTAPPTNTLSPPTGDTSNYTPTVPQGNPIIPAGTPLASRQFTDSINQYVNSQLASAQSQLPSPASPYQALTDAANAPPATSNGGYTEQPIPFQPIAQPEPGATDLQSLQQIMQQLYQQPLSAEQALAALTNYAPPTG